MLVVFLTVFVACTKIVLGYNFEAPLKSYNLTITKITYGEEIFKRKVINLIIKVRKTFAFCLNWFVIR